jgi:predicted DNA-binding protein (MmcQ/YjbR family)
MDILSFREYCLSFPETAEDTPFGPDVLVFKVNGKMFTLCDLEFFESINLKCEPEKAVILRSRYNSVKPGYHMNKKHWNTIDMDGSIPDSKIKEWISESYVLVVQKMVKKDKERILGKLD